MHVLMTNVMQYAGPGTIPALLREHDKIYCHDRRFADEDELKGFESAHPGAIGLRAQTPELIAKELSERKGLIGTVIHNDVHPNQPLPVEDIPVEMFQAAFEALMLFPLRLTQQLLPQMKQAKCGSFVFVTSARYLQPEAGFSVATSIRSATTSFAMALAKETAAHGISVNVVAPNYLYSEAYYPKENFIDNPEGRSEIAAKVPLGRLGRPEEIGELICFLASGRAPFVTGQIINFTGGWP
jgi:NAD(P)-dependent dehydrogenase (short-subunit alcohol dehydrogenase family)